MLCAASCHDEVELARAVELGVDFVVLGPVLPTPSHATVRPLGWTRFEEKFRTGFKDGSRVLIAYTPAD